MMCCTYEHDDMYIHVYIMYKYVHVHELYMMCCTYEHDVHTRLHNQTSKSTLQSTLYTLP